MDKKREAYLKAIEVLASCSKPNGFYASGLPGGYEAVWARDSMVTSLGASFFPEFKKPIKKSLELLAKNQTEFGLVPNCVGSYNTDRQSDITFNSLDAPLWYIIGHYFYAKNYLDKSLLKKHKNNIAKALFWLKCQDPDNLGLIVQQPTMDWQDAFPHKYGYTIYAQSLFYAALKFLGELKSAEAVKKTINGEKRAYAALYDKKLGYYYPWGWKNHDGDREHEEWFDTAGNLLAVITGLATPAIALNILKFIEKAKINKPYPCKAIWPPLKKGGPGWHSYFEKCDAREPYNYLNAGIWPFIGGLYVVALIKMKKYALAEKELVNLAKANLAVIKNPESPSYIITKNKKRLFRGELVKLRRKEFNEWLHGKTGAPMGEPFQGWSAGTYVYAYKCLERKKVLIF
ncbi:MAG: glycoside hydrolase 100 family protein [Patescibacteria group bacterium]|nr:glycoside hydrolase 100 family protein [Patescibacteria group bacterium]